MNTMNNIVCAYPCPQLRYVPPRRRGSFGHDDDDDDDDDALVSSAAVCFQVISHSSYYTFISD
jgi:hypothetical protein